MIMLKIQPGGICQKIDIEGNLESLQNEIGCDTITLANIYSEFDDMKIDIYADDNGLLVDNPQFSIALLGRDGQIASGVAGTVLLCSHDEEGNLVGLTPDQIVFIINNMSGLVIQQADGTKIGVVTFIFDEKINAAIREMNGDDQNAE